ncbi:SpoIIE family protein phosphatase [Bacteroidales bacterium AH-315-N07]|nr:SpoIIE family protein phosphatase [Bacteroidales bacterium AH-315-N07]
MKSISYLITNCILLYLVFHSQSTTLKAQRGNFRNYSVEEGLAQASVYDIYQDSKGYLWLATAGGVSRFNGKDFTNITTAEGLVSNRTHTIISDWEGNIWIGTDLGISILKTDLLSHNLDFEIKNITTKHKLVHNTVKKILEDSKNNLWIGTEGGISICIKSDSLNIDSTKFINITVEDGLISDQINDIFEDSYGEYWIATNKGVSHMILKNKIIDKNNFEYSITNYTISDGLAGNLVVKIVEDNRDHYLWFATDYGITYYDRNKFRKFNISLLRGERYCKEILLDKSGKLWFIMHKISIYDGINFKHLTPYHGLPQVGIGKLFQDFEGNIWLGTTGDGVYRYSGQTFTVYDKDSEFMSDNIRAILEDNVGNIWFGSLQGISKFDPKKTDKIVWHGSKHIENLNSKDQGIVFPSIWSLMEDSKGNVWIGTGAGISKIFPDKNGNTKYEFFTDKDGLKAPAIMALYEDSKRNIWAASFGGLAKYNNEIREQSSSTGSFGAQQSAKFITYSEQDGLANNKVLVILEDRRGNLWIGTAKGISKFKYSDHEIIEFENYSTKDGLVNNKVLSIVEDGEGNLWFGTGGGISKFTHPVVKSSRGRFQNFTTRDGLSSDTPYLLVIDDLGNLWVGTNKGLDKVYIKGSQFKIIKHYGRLEGFSGIETNHNAVYKDRQGHIWFGTVEGAIKYDPWEDKTNHIEPRTIITNLKIFLVNASFPKDGIFPYDKNHLTFEFDGISLTIPEKVRYKFKLEGFDKDWSPPVKEKFATYSYLSPGTYTFMVKACNNDGIWNIEPVIYSFYISPPFWKTWWFYGLSIMFIVGSLYGAYRWRIRNLNREKRILEIKVFQRTKELAQKNQDIMDSIHYAKRIQDAILPDLHFIKKGLPKSFILYKPRDVVSGDFYWFAPKNDHCIIAACDCTGHGVPGAFVSMIGNDLLNQIVIEKGITLPSDILMNLNSGVRFALNQDQEDPSSFDGMDVAMCNINLESKMLQYSGALRPLYLIRNINSGNKNKKIRQPADEEEKLTVIAPQKIGIGGIETIERKYIDHQIQLIEGDTFYMFSDGFTDQFGGPKNRKYSSKRLREFLCDIQDYSMDEQHEIIDNEIETWKGDLLQTDDIMLIGIRI